MLTADLVRARRRGDELKIQLLDPKSKERAVELATEVLAIVSAHVGLTRGELDESLEAMVVPSRDRKLFLAMKKLALDRCEIEAPAELDVVSLRRELFEAAAAERREHGTIDRDRLIAACAEKNGIEPQALDAALFSDLRDGHKLMRVEAISAAALVDGYDVEQLKATLLRATKLTARVRCATPAGYRALFRALKFRRLLFTVKAMSDGAFVITLDGPLSLFSSVTKYGLALALALPSILACDAWAIEAEVRWGKDRTPLFVRKEGRSSLVMPEPEMIGPVATLLARFEDPALGFVAEPATEIFDLPGLGMVIPDIRFTSRETGEVLFLEVLGFWSREAVWKRVELVRAGLSQRVLFAVPKKLRVSEAVLDDDLPSALYVFGETPNAAQVATLLGSLAARRAKEET